MEISYNLNGERVVARLPDTVEQITVRIAANIFEYIKNNPFPNEAVTDFLDGEDAPQTFAYQRALDSWHFGFLQACCIEGAIPETWNLAKYALPEKDAEKVYKIIDRLIIIRDTLLTYNPAPLDEIVFRGVKYVIPKKIGVIRTGRAVRSGAYAEALEGLAGGKTIHLAGLCAGLLFTESELDAELSDIRKPIPNSVFDARAKLFEDLPFIYASDVAFFLLSKSRNYKRFLDMRSTQVRIIQARGKKASTKKAH